MSHSESENGRAEQLRQDVLKITTLEQAGEAERSAREVSARTLQEKGIGPSFASAESEAYTFRARFWQIKAAGRSSKISERHRENAVEMLDRADIFGRMADGQELTEGEQAVVNVEAIRYMRNLAKTADQAA